MTKDVLISLRGLQFDQSDTDAEKIETIMPGSYYEKKDFSSVLLKKRRKKPVQNPLNKFFDAAL